jgi:arylsulfatase A-like enzyme
MSAARWAARHPWLLRTFGFAAVAIGLMLSLGSGWLRLLALALGAAALLVSVTSVQERIGRAWSRSTAESPGLLAKLTARPARAFLYGAWFALVASAGEAAYRSYQQWAGVRVLGPEYFWRIPLANGLLFAAAALLVVLIARRRPSWSWVPPGLALFAFVAAAAVLFLVGDLHDAAAAVLAGGAAVQVGRAVRLQSWLVDRLVRYSLVPLALVVVGMALGTGIWPRWQEHRTLATLPAPATPRPPDVLLIVLDTVRAKSLSVYGYERPTSPRLAAFAERGVVFTRAFATSPWTLPTHGSLFTGRWPHELGGDFMAPLNDAHQTLAEALAREGYVTAGFVANHVYGAAPFGLARGFAHYEDRVVAPYTVLTGASFPAVLANASGLPRRFAAHDNLGRKSARQVNRDYLRWRASRRDDRPSFVFLNYYDAHAAYLAPDEYTRRFAAVRPDGDVWARPLDAWTPDEIRELNDAYDSTIAYLDHHVGELLATLDAEGALAGTVVVVTSDHGEQFGEHGLLEHANSLYLPLLHVPLLIVAPRSTPGGVRIDQPVSLRDVASTVFDLTDVPNPGLPGESLRRFWDSDEAVPAPLLAETQQAYSAYPDHYPARRGAMASVIVDGMHYIRHLSGGREELYDLTRDPDELVDLAAVEQKTLDHSRRLLQALRGNPDP